MYTIGARLPRNNSLRRVQPLPSLREDHREPKDWVQERVASYDAILGIVPKAHTVNMLEVTCPIDRPRGVRLGEQTLDDAVDIALNAQFHHGLQFGIIEQAVGGPPRGGQ